MTYVGSLAIFRQACQLRYTNIVSNPILQIPNYT